MILESPRVYAGEYVKGLATETLERRFDAAFGVTRTETERNELLSQRVQELEQDIREAFWVDDEARIERDHYERLRARKRHRPVGSFRGGR